jgi:hypothetical protein
VATWAYEDDGTWTLDSAAHSGLHGDGKGRAEWERPGESGCSSEFVGEEANEIFGSAWGSSSG